MPPKGCVHKVKKPRPSARREIDLYEVVEIAPYDSGAIPGGIRAWNDAHEEMMEGFYSDSRPVKMTVSELNEYLRESAFADRERGRGTVVENAIPLAARIHSSDFKTTYLDPFKAMSQLQREEVVLNALAERARSYARDGLPFGWQRKLIPEITLEKLCADDGEGLSSFFSFLSHHILEPNLVTSPIPHAGLFRKFGIVLDAGVLPAARNRRAWIEDTLLIRTSMLLLQSSKILDTIIGKHDNLEFPGTDSFASKPEKATSDVPRKTSDTTSKDDGSCVELRCQWCYRTARQAEVPQLLRCGRCLAVGRTQLYCSHLCQTADYAGHKSACGKIREDADIPTFTSTASKSSIAGVPSNITRRLLLRSLDSRPNEYWGVCSNGFSVGFMSEDFSTTTTTTVRRAMRKLAYSALLDDNPTAINLLAAVVLYKPLETVAHPALTHQERHHTTPGVYDKMREEFMEMFSLDDDGLEEAKRAGKAELKKPEWSTVKEVYDCARKQGTYDWDHYVKNTFRFDGLPAEDADDLRSMMKVMLKTASSEPIDEEEDDCVVC